MFNDFYRGKKVLLTGHTGFKGSWMSIWLKELGADVYGYALKPQTLEDNFAACGLDRIINHRVGDVRNRKELSDFFSEIKPEIVFHLAAQPLVLKSYQDPVETFDVNLMGVVNFFEAVRSTSSIKVAINITSDKCYDNKEWLWGYRENDPMGGKDPYSASKGCAELITSSYLHSFFNEDGQSHIASVRAGNVIGGGDWSDNRIIPDFFRSLKQGKELNVRNPLAVRPWQFVLEPVSGYLALAAALHADKVYSGSWNFGPKPENHHDVKTLIESIIKYCKKGENIFASQEPSVHEAHLLKLDISKAIALLNWKPVLNFDETIRYTVDGYLDQIDNRDLLNSRIKQIKDYYERAQTLNINWAIDL